MKTRNEPKHIAVTIFLLLAVVAIAVLGSSCANQNYQFVTGPKGNDAPDITTQPAQSSDCLQGGVEIDINRVKSSFVCNGLAGINTAPITVIQFCKGTTVYPSEFNEVGFVINGKVYGIYSINNGALVYLPPGQYSSNVLNSRCSFTLNSNNTVTN